MPIHIGEVHSSRGGVASPFLHGTQGEYECASSRGFKHRILSHTLVGLALRRIHNAYRERKLISCSRANGKFRSIQFVLAEKVTMQSSRTRA